MYSLSPRRFTMVAASCVKGHHCRVLTALCLIALAAVVSESDAQYAGYNFRSFPQDELAVPLDAAYGLAVEQYAAGNWTESIRRMEASLRLRRLLRDSVRYCARHCNKTSCEGDEDVSFGQGEDRFYSSVLMKASCLKRCRRHFPVLSSLPYPGAEVLDHFDTKRSPYRYLYFAYAKLNDLQKAVPCAHTYLQKNPADQEIRQLIDHYHTQYDLDGYLTDLEAPPYEITFLNAVKLIGSEDYSGGVEYMEKALRQSLEEHALCQAECEVTARLTPASDLHSVLADAYIEALRCKVGCEEKLMPNIGGNFMEKFIATIYHYLQYAYYKSDRGSSAVPCASSYHLFEPEDQVMNKNLQYYQAYEQQWGLNPTHFKPRTEAVQYYNQTTTLRRMLASAERYLLLDDEDFFGAEEAAMGATESPDVEFEGPGDYEESIYAKWSQPKHKGDAGHSDTRITATGP